MLSADIKKALVAGDVNIALPKEIAQKINFDNKLVLLSDSGTGYEVEFFAENTYCKKIIGIDFLKDGYFRRKIGKISERLATNFYGKNSK